MRRFWKPSRWVLLGAFVSAVLVGGVAWAKIPGDDGMINACYHKSNGAVRVIDSSVERCKQNETAISWTAGQQRIPGPAVMHSNQGVDITLPVTGPHTLITKMELPPADPYTNMGWWATTATVWMNNNETHPVEVSCEVMSDDGVNGLGWAIRLQPGRFNQAVFPSGVGGKHVNLFCGFVNNTTPGFADNVVVKAWSITALPAHPAPGEG